MCNFYGDGDIIHRLKSKIQVPSKIQIEDQEFGLGSPWRCLYYKLGLIDYYLVVHVTQGLSISTASLVLPLSTVPESPIWKACLCLINSPDCWVAHSVCHNNIAGLILPTVVYWAISQYLTAKMEMKNMMNVIGSVWETLDKMHQENPDKYQVTCIILLYPSS